MAKAAPFPIAEPLKIGELHRLSGLSRRALRHYEQHGLIHADRTSANVRCYDFATRDRVRWIARLRRAGLGLAEIGEVLGPARGGQPEPQLALALSKLAMRAERLRAELAETEVLIRTLRTEVEAADGLARPERWRPSRAAGG